MAYAFWVAHANHMTEMDHISTQVIWTENAETS